MKVARLRTLTLFSMKEDIMELENFIDSTKILEKNGIDVRTKRVAVEKIIIQMTRLSPYRKNWRHLDTGDFVLHSMILKIMTRLIVQRT